MWALAAPGMAFGGPYFVGFGASGISGSNGPWIWVEVAPGAAVLRTARAVWHCTSDSFQIMC
jgi:hypothetical protein